MTQTKIAPSRVARTMAGQLWPDVQSQNQIAKGIYGFSCAGHGGIIAVIGTADLNERAVEIARAEGKTEFVGSYFGRLITSEKYTPATFEQMRERGMEVWEVLVGEEDCDWAVVIMAATDPQAVIEGARNKYLAEHVDYPDVESTVMSWNPDFFEALFGVTVPTASSHVKQQRKFAADNADSYVVVSAQGDWHEKVPSGMVGVMATKGGQRTQPAWGEAKYFLVPSERYAARDGSFIITDEQEWEDHS